MATAYGTVETAVEAMKHGAFDYIRKPINFDSFQFIVQQALNERPLMEYNISILLHVHLYT